MRLLIIGNLDGHMTAASQIALDQGVKVSIARTLEDGLRHIRSGKGADLVLIDVHLPLERLAAQLKKERITVPLVACGLEGTDSDLASDAILAGASEYVPLPPDPELIATVLKAVVQQDDSVIYRDPKTMQVLAMADQIAPSEASVLITGESGTGKEVFARYLHARSKRSSGTFVALNCAAIPENLLESELFGHERGAFSGAVAQRIGKFEEADQGTLLLDEISEMDLRLQAKLLRAIQEKEIDRLGGNGPVPVNVRILATSNRDLEAAVDNGDFRQDLYFRLNVVNLQLPALRDRPLDIPILAEFFEKKYAKLNGMDSRPITTDARGLLVNHSWPGNVRELENTMHRAILLSQGPEIEAEAIILSSGRARPSAGAGTVGQSLALVERRHIMATLDHCLGNLGDAAAILGISLRQLDERLETYGISPGTGATP